MQLPHLHCDLLAVESADQYPDNNRFERVFYLVMLLQQNFLIGRNGAEMDETQAQAHAQTLSPQSA